MSDWLTDVLIILGALLVTVMLALLDWHYAGIWLGLLLLVAGIVRLPRRR